MTDDEGSLHDLALEKAHGLIRERLRREDRLRPADALDPGDAAEMLRRRSEWLRVTLASMGDAVITTSTDGRVISLNPVAEALTGRSEAEARGLPLEAVFVIINEEGHSPAEHPTGPAMREGAFVALSRRTLLVPRTGKKLAIDASAAPIRDDDGTLLGSVLIFRDATGHRRADSASRQLAAVVQQSDDAIITKDLNGVITSWNSGAERIFGYTAEEIIGRSIITLIPRDLWPEEDDILSRLRRGEQVQSFETVRLHKSGHRLHISVTVTPLRDATGKVVGASKIGRDVTLPRRRERMNRFLSESSAALADLSDYETTLQRVARLAVPAFADICAVDIRTDDGAIRRVALVYDGGPDDSLTPEVRLHDQPTASEEYGATRALREGESLWYPVVTDDFLRKVARSDRHLEWLRGLQLRSYICVPIRSRRSAVGALTFATTGTGPGYDRYDLRVAEDLAHRAAVAIENAALVATLRDLDRRKDEFIAMLAHELRNPLAPIRNAAHVIRACASPAPELGRATAIIERQVHQMTRLVDDLLDVSRINSGKITLHRGRIAVADVIKAVLESSEQTIIAREHELHVTLPEAPVYLDADPVRLGQVVSNLLDNAAKYTDRGGRIAVRVLVDDGHAEIRVADNGIGIAKEMQGKIFEMFTQVDVAVNRAQGGLGIGLMLVRRLVEMHGGTVRVESEGVGMGSEFVVRVPVEGWTPGGSNALTP